MRDHEGLVTIKDMMGRDVSIDHPPQRIISLVPSQTELLYDLGLENEVIGMTKFCVHPKAWKSQKAIIGGTKNFHKEKIVALAPDLIIGNKEENYKEGIQDLETLFPVLMTDIVTLKDAFRSISLIGEATSKKNAAREIVRKIESAFSLLPHYEPDMPLSVLYLIWQDPFIGVGSETFIHEMIGTIGLINVLKDRPRYPELTQDEIRHLKPDLIFLSSEPYPFKEKHIKSWERMSPGSNVLLVDGEMFSWYGSRLIKAPAYFTRLLGDIGLI